MPKFTKPRSLDIEPGAYYKITKIAPHLDISIDTLMREIEDGKIKAKRFRKKVISIKGSELLKYLKKTEI